MKRQYKPTSKEGEQFIKPHKPSHQAKIIEALERLRVGGTQEEIASISGLRPDQTWKRLSELQRKERIFDTGITRKLKSGVNGIVWQLTGGKVIDLSNPKTDSELKQSNKLKQLNLL